MNINGKWYTETEAAAYIAELESRLRDRDLEADNGARQIAHYSDELRQAKELLKAAVEDIHELLCDRKNLDGIGQSCNVCSYIDNCPCCNRCDIIPELRTWRYADEALALIGKDMNVPANVSTNIPTSATDINVGGKGGADNDS